MEGDTQPRAGGPRRWGCFAGRGSDLTALSHLHGPGGATSMQSLSLLLCKISLLRTIESQALRREKVQVSLGRCGAGMSSF